MKFFIGFVLLIIQKQISVTTAKIIPSYLPQPCAKSVPNYSDCTLRIFQKMGPYLLKGVQEINFPKMNPWHAPPLSINMTLNQFIGITTFMKNTQIWGFNTVNVDNFKFNTYNMSGELHLKWPSWHLNLDYDMVSRPLSFDLNRAGRMESNITNSEYLFKFSLKQIEKRSIKYYALDTFKAQINTGDASIKVITKNPNGQVIANLLSNLYNANSHRALDATHAVCEESVRVIYKSLVERVLSTVPAKELFPE